MLLSVNYSSSVYTKNNGPELCQTERAERTDQNYDKQTYR